MSNWVISCNPQVYNHAASFKENGFIDWATINNFSEGDVVFIYEATPPRGRGAIVYKAVITDINLTIDNKTDDRQFWKNSVYPKDYTGYKFSRMKLIDERNEDGLSLNSLKNHGFTAPQGFAYLLDNRPKLLNYIHSHFEQESLG